MSRSEKYGFWGGFIGLILSLILIMLLGYKEILFGEGVAPIIGYGLILLLSVGGFIGGFFYGNNPVEEGKQKSSFLGFFIGLIYSFCLSLFIFGIVWIFAWILNLEGLEEKIPKFVGYFIFFLFQILFLTAPILFLWVNTLILKKEKKVWIKRGLLVGYIFVVTYLLGFGILEGLGLG